MFVASGVGPVCRPVRALPHYAPEKIAYAVNRYEFEAQRHFGILDARLAKKQYMVGDTYTIVDMAVWGWARLVPNVLGEDAGRGLPTSSAWSTRSAPARRPQQAVALKDRHAFKTEMDEDAVAAMFPHMKEKVA